MNSETGSTVVLVLGFIEICLIAVVGYFLSVMVGNKDNSNDLAKTVVPVTGTMGGIVFLHTIIWYLYFTYDPMSMNLYFLVSNAISLIISLTAISISLTSRA
jgi:hypothetical protein